MTHNNPCWKFLHELDCSKVALDANDIWTVVKKKINKIFTFSFHLKILFICFATF